MLTGKSDQVKGLLLDNHEGWEFWRFDFNSTLGEKGRTLEYLLDAQGLSKADRSGFCSKLG